MNEYQVFKAGPKKGQPKTLTDRVVRYLVEGMGMKESSSRSRYREFSRGGRSYFVGKAGAVRVGRTASNSFSLTDSLHARMREWEKRLQETVDKVNEIIDRQPA